MLAQGGGAAHASMIPQQEADATIEAAIREAEDHTSAEIRVFITRHAPDAARASEEAARHFQRLTMTRTPMRNAVLLYVAPASSQVAVAADEAVCFQLGKRFFNAIQRAAAPHLPHDAPRAILEALRATARPLARRFPRSSFDRDNLPNAVLRD